MVSNFTNKDTWFKGVVHTTVSFFNLCFNESFQKWDA